MKDTLVEERSISEGAPMNLTKILDAHFPTVRKFMVQKAP